MWLLAIGAAIGAGIAFLAVGLKRRAGGERGADGHVVARLRQIALHNELILNSAGEGIFGLDRDRRITFFNPAAERLTGWTEREAVGQPVTAVVGDDLGTVPPASAEMSLRRRDGEDVPVDIAASPIIEGQKITGWVVVCRDIRERRQAEENHRLAAAVLEWSAQSVLVTDLAHVIVMANPALTWLSGYPADALIGRPAALLAAGDPEHPVPPGMRAALAQDGAWRGEVWNRHRDGSLYAAWLNITRIGADGGATGLYVAFLFDITDRKRREETLLHAAHYDALTGLPNRRLLHDHLAVALARTGPRLALMLIDLDGFKAVNDTVGHDAGDAVLVAVAGRLRGAVRAGDMVARLGGDEFVVIVEDADRPAACRAAEALVRDIARPVPFRGRTLRVSASIGIALPSPAGRTAADLIQAADAAMYAVKRSGKRGYRFHDDPPADDPPTDDPPALNGEEQP